MTRARTRLAVGALLVATGACSSPTPGHDEPPPPPPAFKRAGSGSWIGEPATTGIASRLDCAALHRAIGEPYTTGWRWRRQATHDGDGLSCLFDLPRDRSRLLGIHYVCRGRVDDAAVTAATTTGRAIPGIGRGAYVRDGALQTWDTDSDCTVTVGGLGIPDDGHLEQLARIALTLVTQADLGRPSRALPAQVP